MKNLTIVKKLGSLMLMLAMVITMSVTALPVFAAAGGTINVTYNPNLGLDPMEFKLYKVAHFDSTSGEAQIKFDTPDFDGYVPPIDVNTIKQPASDADKEEGSEWNKKWLTIAQDLDNWIKGKSITPYATKTLEDKSGPQSITVADNGVYLLTASGNEQRIGDQYWAPVPVLIMVLNGDTAFKMTNIDLKMTTRGVVHTHTVTKAWAGDTGYESGRPKSVKVGIIYGGKQIDTVELSNDNNWTYTWYSQESVDRKYSSKNLETDEGGVTTEKLNPNNDYTIPLEGSGVWAVTELDNTGTDLSTTNAYTWSVTGPVQSGDSESFNITNTMIIPVIQNPPVYKTVKGKGADEDDTFEFKLEAVSNTAGVESPMPEGSKNGVKVIETEAEVLEEFGEMEFKTPGEYYYKISEVNTGKKGYVYDTTVYILHYTVSLEGSKYVAKLETTKNGEVVKVSRYDFVNEYNGPPKKPNTGDYTNIALPVAIFAGAMIVLIVMLLRRRQKKDN